MIRSMRGVGRGGGTPVGAPGLTTPAWIATGTQGEGPGGGVSAAYGANALGDLFLMQIVARNITSYTIPTGWTERDGPDTLGNTSSYWLTRDTRSTGGEVATVPVSIVSNSNLVLIHTFRYVALAAYFESLSAGGNAANDSSIEAPTVAAVGLARLAVALGGCGAQFYPPSFTGMTGGTWVRRAFAVTGIGSDCGAWMQTADLATGGTISGGSSALGSSENWAQHGFALVGS